MTLPPTVTVLARWQHWDQQVHNLRLWTDSLPQTDPAFVFATLGPHYTHQGGLLGIAAMCGPLARPQRQHFSNVPAPFWLVRYWGRLPIPALFDWLLSQRPQSADLVALLLAPGLAWQVPT